MQTAIRSSLIVVPAALGLSLSPNLANLVTSVVIALVVYFTTGNRPKD